MKIFNFFILLFVFHTSLAETVSDKIVINVRRNEINNKVAIVRFINNDFLPHVILVKIFNNALDDGLISGAVVSLPPHSKHGIEVNSLNNSYFNSDLYWRYFDYIGDLGPHKNVYFSFPFSEKVLAKITQSKDGPQTTHHGDAVNAIDFSVPEKTPILSIGNGVVINVVQNYTEGGFKPDLSNKVNLISILHYNGQISEYLHIYPNSSSVKVGDKVTVGQQIALVGNVGFSNGPHLHLQLIEIGATLDKNNSLRRIVPIKFYTPDKKEIKILYNHSYSYDGEKIDPRHPQPRSKLSQHVRPIDRKELQDRFNNRLGVSNIGPVAVDAKWSNYGSYLQRMIETVQIEWERILIAGKVYPNSGSYVQVKFIMNSKGEITKIVRVDPTGAPSDAAIRACEAGITARSPYGQWTEDMIAVLGEQQEMTFVFYYE